MNEDEYESWNEYCALKSKLSYWIQKQTFMLRRIKDGVEFVHSSNKAHDLIDELNRFKDNELPIKQVELNSLVLNYLQLEAAAHESKGRFKIGDSSAPNELLFLWRSLHDFLSDRNDRLLAVLD